MPSNYDTNIDIERAKNLKREIEAEFANVSALLVKVANECNAAPGEDDTVLIAVEQAGKELDEAWKNLAKGFESAMETLGKIISNFADWVENKVEEINEFRSKKSL